MTYTNLKITNSNVVQNYLKVKNLIIKKNKGGGVELRIKKK